MPRFDGTGPWGAGAMTGGGRGFCAPFGARGGRRPWGFHHRFNHPHAGYGYPYAGAPTREQEINYLKSEADSLRRALDEINARVQTLSEEK